MLGNLIGGFKMAGALVPASLKLPLLVGASIVAAPIGYIFSGTVLSVGKIAAVACAPFLNQNVAENAIANNNAGLLEFSSALDSILTKIPYIGDKFKLNLDKGQLQKAVQQGNVEVAEVLIDKTSQIGKTEALKNALNKKDAGADYLAQKLINKGADLSQNVDVDNFQIQSQHNLFQEVLKTGKEELIKGALKQAASKEVLVNSKDVDGNNLAHFEAVSKELKTLATEAGVKLTEASLQAANNKGKTALDVAAFKEDAGTMAEYLKGGATSLDKNLFTKSLESDKIKQTEVPKLLVENNFVQFDQKNGYGEIPLDTALSQSKDSTLVKMVADKTPSEQITNKHLAKAMFKGQADAGNVLSQKLFGEADVEIKQQAFFKNPLEDGRTVLEIMTVDENNYNEAFFDQAYNSLKNGGVNPLKITTQATGNNLLVTAAMKDNTQVVEKIGKIIENEGLIDHKDIIIDGMTVPTLVNHGYQEQMGKIAVKINNALKDENLDFNVSEDLDIMQKNIVNEVFKSFDIQDSSGNIIEKAIKNEIFKEIKKTGNFSTLKALQSPDQKKKMAILDQKEEFQQIQQEKLPTQKEIFQVEQEDFNQGQIVQANKVDQLVQQGYFLSPKQDIVEREEKILKNIQEIEQVNIEKEVLVRQSTRTSIADESKQGMPDFPEIKAMEKYAPKANVIDSAHMNAANAGYAGITLVEGMEEIKYWAPESLKGYIPTDKYVLTGLYGLSSAALMYGSNPGKAFHDVLKSAGYNTAIYAARKFSNYQAPTIDVGSESKGFFDFAYKFGGSIAFDTAATVAQTAAIMALTGATFGAGAIVVPAAMTFGTDLVKYVGEYVGSINHDSVAGKVLPYLATVGAVYSSYNNMAGAAGSAISQNLQTIQKGFALLSTATTAHQLTSLVTSSADSYLDKAEDWMYDHTIGYFNKSPVLPISEIEEF